jgi:hypothetical protein
MGETQGASFCVPRDAERWNRTVRGEHEPRSENPEPRTTRLQTTAPERPVHERSGNLRLGQLRDRTELRQTWRDIRRATTRSRRPFG